MLLIVFPAIGQNCNYSLYGIIQDAGTRQPLPGATVSLSGESKIAITDKEGHFHFNRLCAGTYKVKISYVGFSEQEIEVNLSKNQEIAISLDTDDNKLAEVVVLSSATLLPLQTANKLEGNALELSRGESLGEALKRLPGLNSIQTGPAISKPVIHGMHSNRVVILNSGVRLEGQQWGSEHAPEVDPFLANQITVVKGAASIQYGADAIGGVILVEPEDLNYHQHLLSGSVNLVGASNNQQGTVSANIHGALENENFAWRLQSTLKKGGNAKTPDYYLGNTGFEELNGAFTLGYKKKSVEAELFLSTYNTSIGIFEGAHIGSLNDLYSVLENGRPFNDGNFSYSIDAPKQEVSHHLIKLKGKKYLANHSSLTLNYNLQRNHRKEYDIRRAGRTGIAALDLVLTAQNLEAVYETSGSNNMHTKYGVNANVVVNNNTPGTFATPVIPNYNSFNPALFMVKRLAKKDYELEGGIRYDYKYLDAAGYRGTVLYGGRHHFHNVSGSVGGLWKVSPLLSLRSNLGLAWRAPSVNELYSDGLHHGSAAIEVGNDLLKSEKGYKWINTLSLAGNRLSVEWSAYSNYITDYIFLEPSGEFEESLRGAFPVFNYRQTNALFLGSDLFASYKFSESLSWNLKAAIIRAKDRSNKNYLPMIPADKLDNSFRWNGLTRHKKFSSPFLEIQHVFVAKQNRFEAANEFTAPPAAYHLVNFSGGINYKTGENSIGINASLFNVFNTSYKDYLNRFRYYAHETGRNLVIRLNYKF